MGAGKKDDEGKPSKPPSAPSAPGERPWWRRPLKWVAIAVLAWLALSFLAFAVSAQIQKFKLADGITEKLGGNPAMLVVPQTILVLGTDVRSGAFAGPEEAETEKCLDEVISGRAKDGSCRNAPYRSDTMMLIRAGRGTFRKLSIPRDTLAEIPGQGPQKINSAYASGGAKLAIRTVEGLLGIDVDQVAIIDFDGFRSFIDTIGGIDVDLPTPVCSDVSGGAFSLDLEAGENHLDGFQAITLARTRSNTCGDGRVHRHRRRACPVPAADPRRDQGQADQHHGAADELRQGAADRLERAQGDGLEHGRADDAPARDLGGDRRRRNRRAQAIGDDGGRQPGRLARGMRAGGGGAAGLEAAAETELPAGVGARRWPLEPAYSVFFASAFFSGFESLFESLFESDVESDFDSPPSFAALAAEPFCL